jgi:hypothetical protein
MKRLIGALLLVLGVIAPMPQTAGAAGAPCTRVTFAEGSYNTFGETATLGLTFDLAAPSCARITYKVAALSTSGDELASSSFGGDGGSRYAIEVPVAGGPTLICAVLTTESSSGKVFDHVPTTNDRDCADGTLLQLNGGSGGQVMR